MNSHKTSLSFLVSLIVLTIAVLLVAPFLGMELITPLSVSMGDISSHILFTIRIPRVITGFIAGAGLALCGMVFQALFRNPLATPFTLGVSSGASFGAALVIVSGITGTFCRIPFTSFGALAGAAGAMFLVYAFSLFQRTISNLTVLLAGIAISFLFSSLLMFVQFLSDLRHSFQIVRWLMGGLEVYGYQDIFTMLPVVVPGILVIGSKLKELDLILTGEDIARTRGVNVGRTKKILFITTSVMVSSIVATCGPIGFVGMMAPHACRLIIGARHGILGPAALLVGGVFLVLCDTAARMVIAPAEMPVGVITSMLGGPFFIWILLTKVARNKGNVW